MCCEQTTFQILFDSNHPGCSFEQHLTELYDILHSSTVSIASANSNEQDANNNSTCYYYKGSLDTIRGACDPYKTIRIDAPPLDESDSANRARAKHPHLGSDFSAGVKPARLAHRQTDVNRNGRVGGPLLVLSANRHLILPASARLARDLPRLRIQLQSLRERPADDLVRLHDKIELRHPRRVEDMFGEDKGVDRVAQVQRRNHLTPRQLDVAEESAA